MLHNGSAPSFQVGSASSILVIRSRERFLASLIRTISHKDLSRAPLTQLAECNTCNIDVVGSIPTGGSKTLDKKSYKQYYIFMNVKICAKCNESKPLNGFNKKGGERLQPYCRECQRELSRQQYAENTDKQKKQVYEKKALRIAQNKKIVKELKESTPCMDCGKRYPYYVMDFDHQHSKEFIISKALNDGTSLERIQKEIDKCELVCANCHRMRTFKLSGDSSIG